MNLTTREKEILAFLKGHPMISQDDLANYFSISRSSAAVHISNLMKKGVILGKGYVFSNSNEVSLEVIGKSCLTFATNGQEINGVVPYLVHGFAQRIKELLERFDVTIKITSVNEPDSLNLYTAEDKNLREMWWQGENYYTVPKDRFNLKDYYDKVITKKKLMQPRWIMLDPDLSAPLTQEWLEEAENGYDLCSGVYIENESQIPEGIYPWSVLVLGVRKGLYLDKLIDKALDSEAHNVVLSDGEDQLFYIQSRKLKEFTLAPKQRFDPRQDMPYILGGLVFGLSSGYSLRQSIRIALGSASRIKEKNNQNDN